MSTYEEFMVILTTAILIVAILEYVNHNLKMPRYANTGTFQIDTIRTMIDYLQQNQYITVLYKMHLFLRKD